MRRREYQLKCTEILVKDIHTAHDCSLDQSLWKTAYYQIIEVMRKMIGSGDDQWEPRMLEQHLSAVLDDVSGCSLLGGLFVCHPLDVCFLSLVFLTT